MTRPVDTMQRWMGLLWLTIAGGMLNWGHLILQPFLCGWVSVVYWLICIALAAAAVIFGFADIRSMRRQIRIEQIRLARRLLQESRKTKGNDGQIRVESSVLRRTGHSGCIL